MAEERSAAEARTVDRLINFTDAVVAVAITLLALPLVDIVGPEPGQSVWTVLGDHAGPLYSFVFTFFVVLAMWGVHNRVMNALVRTDGVISWLNAFWLALIVLLPWFSSMYGESQVFASDGDGNAQGVGVLYWCTLAAISLIGSAMGWRMRAVPSVRAAESGDGYRTSRDRLSMWRGPILAAYFAFIGVVSITAATAATWLPLGIIPLSIWLRHPLPKRAH